MIGPEAGDTLLFFGMNVQFASVMTGLFALTETVSAGLWISQGGNASTSEICKPGCT